MTFPDDCHGRCARGISYDVRFNSIMVFKDMIQNVVQRGEVTIFKWLRAELVAKIPVKTCWGKNSEAMFLYVFVVETRWKLVLGFVGP